MCVAISVLTVIIALGLVLVGFSIGWVSEAERKETLSSEPLKPLRDEEDYDESIDYLS